MPHYQLATYKHTPTPHREERQPRGEKERQMKRESIRLRYATSREAESKKRWRREPRREETQREKGQGRRDKKRNQDLLSKLRPFSTYHCTAVMYVIDRHWRLAGIKLQLQNIIDSLRMMPHSWILFDSYSNFSNTC